MMFLGDELAQAEIEREKVWFFWGLSSRQVLLKHYVEDEAGEPARAFQAQESCSLFHRAALKGF